MSHESHPEIRFVARLKRLNREAIMEVPVENLTLSRTTHSLDHDFEGVLRLAPT